MGLGGVRWVGHDAGGRAIPTHGLRQNDRYSFHGLLD